MDVGVALVGSLHQSQMERVGDTGAGMGQCVKAFTCNPLVSDIPQYTPDGQETAFSKEEYILVARPLVCGKNNSYLIHRPTEKHLPGQQETS